MKINGLVARITGAFALISSLTFQALAQEPASGPASAPVMSADELLTAPLATSEPASEPAASMPTVDRDVVLAQTVDGDFTIGDLEPVVKAQIRTGDAAAVEQMLLQPAPVLQQQAAGFLAERQLAKEVREKHPGLLAKWSDDLIQIEGKQVLEWVFRDRFSSTRTVTDEQARDYYEKNKIKYHTPLKFKMRHLFFSAYTPYTAQPGDTLESIAKKVAGSEELVSGIRTDTVGKLSRWVAPEDRNRIPYIALTPGERLLVPMSKESRAQMRKDLETLVLPRLKKGESFEALCVKYSEADDKGQVTDWLPFATMPILPEIAEVAKTIPLNKVSDVIETRHGLEVIQVVERVDERQIPFEEASEKIKLEMIKANLGREITSLTDKVRTRLKIDTKAIVDKKTDPAKVVLETSTRKWTFAQVEELIGEEIGSMRSPDAIDSLIRGNQLILNQLYLEYARDERLYEQEDFRRALEMRKDHELAQKLIEYRIKEKTNKLTDADYKKWYEENTRVFVTPSTYQVRQIVVRLDPKADLKNPKERARAESEALERLRKAVSGVKTQEDFIEAVGRFSEDPASSARGGSIGQVMSGYKTGPFGEMLKKAPVKAPSAPFVHNDLAYVIWIDEKNEVKPEPYEKEKQRVQQQLQATISEETKGELMRQALETIKFKAVGAS